MSFRINKNNSEKAISKEQLLNSDVAKKLKAKGLQKIGLIFDHFNTTKANSGEKEVLDKEEQLAMMDWFESLAGKNEKLSRREFRKGKKQEETKDEYAEGAKYKDYKNFYNAYSEAVQKAPALEQKVAEEKVGVLEDVMEEEVIEDSAKRQSTNRAIKPSNLKKISQPKAWQKANPKEAIGDLKDSDDTADKVLAKLISTYGIEADKVQMNKLKADLIKYNPSIFDKNGNVYANTEWEKLDFPKEAGKLYKKGVKTPTVAKAAAKRPAQKAVKKAAPAKSAVSKAADSKAATQTKKADAAINADAAKDAAPIEAKAEIKRDEAGNEIPGNIATSVHKTQLIKKAPAAENIKTVKVGKYSFKVAQKGTNFANPLAIGTDFTTGANLNLTPLFGIPLKENRQERNGKIYRYHNNRLSSIEDKTNKKEYQFWYNADGSLSDYSERGENNGIKYYISREANGKLKDYITYEPGFDNVHRNPDGSVKYISELSDNRIVDRDSKGKLEYYKYDGDVWRNADGSEWEGE